MVILSVTNSPPSLRGALSRWMIEIDTGVYVGKMSAKVRDLLWERVCNNIKSGRATMIYSSNNEQGYEFKTHNSLWEVCDFEGLNLLKRPILSMPKNNENKEAQSNKHFSKAYANLMAMNNKKTYENYVIVDIETTGLDKDKDEIIEIGLITVDHSQIKEKADFLVKSSDLISKNIENLTGIDNDLLEKKGVSIVEALEKTMKYIANRTIVGYNVNFDCMFLRKACSKYGVTCTIRKVKDIRDLSRKKLKNLPNYKLETVVKKLGIQEKQKHRALDDCELELQVLNKLNKK